MARLSTEKYQLASRRISAFDRRRTRAVERQQGDVHHGRFGRQGNVLKRKETGMRVF
jgi:hypothetical protein